MLGGTISMGAGFAWIDHLADANGDHARPGAAAAIGLFVGMLPFPPAVRTKRS